MKETNPSKTKQGAGKEKRTKTKLRWIKPGTTQNYVKKQCMITEASSIMKIRLHMVNAKANYGGGICRKCETKEETTEHVLKCQTNGVLEFDEEMTEDVNWLRKINRIYRQFDEQYKINNETCTKT